MGSNPAVLNPMADKRIHWKKPQLDRDVLRSLATRNDARAWAQMLGEIGVVVAVGIVAHVGLARWSLLVSLPLLYLHFVLYSWLTREGAFHELIHRTPFASKRSNEFFFRVITFLGWMNGDAVRDAHMVHHQNTLHEGRDHDVALDMSFLSVFEIPMALTFHFRHLFRDLGRLVSAALGKIDSDLDPDYVPGPSDAAKRRYVRTARVTLIGHAVLIAAFLATGNWVLVLTISLGPFFATWAHLLPSMTQHVGMRRNVNDWRENARSVQMGPLGSFLYWRMQYHIEHHMYPSVPFYNLRRLRTELAPYLPERRTLLQAWIDIVRYVRAYRRDPGAYIAVEDLPDL